MDPAMILPRFPSRRGLGGTPAGDVQQGSHDSCLWEAFDTTRVDTACKLYVLCRLGSGKAFLRVLHEEVSWACGLEFTESVFVKTASGQRI